MTLDANDVQRNSEIRRLELEKIIKLEKAAVCPNAECGKMFQNALVLTDLSKKPHETYHACPHCFSKVSIVVKTECQHYFGYLKKLPKNASIPDECLTCPKITQCLFNYHLG